MTATLIVTGARAWPESAARVIWELLTAHTPGLVVHGGCGEGADDIAEGWCRRSEVDSRIVRARWHGPEGAIDRSAGMRRNIRMLELFPGEPVLGFPYGKSAGTRGCMRAAVERGHPVLAFDPSGRVLTREEWDT